MPNRPAVGRPHAFRLRVKQPQSRAEQRGDVFMERAALSRFESNHENRLQTITLFGEKECDRLLGKPHLEFFEFVGDTGCLAEYVERGRQIDGDNLLQAKTVESKEGRKHERRQLQMRSVEDMTIRTMEDAKTDFLTIGCPCHGIPRCRARPGEDGVDCRKERRVKQNEMLPFFQQTERETNVPQGRDASQLASYRRDRFRISAECCMGP